MKINLEKLKSTLEQTLECVQTLTEVCAELQRQNLEQKQEIDSLEARLSCVEVRSAAVLRREFQKTKEVEGTWPKDINDYLYWPSSRCVSSQ